VKLRSQRTLGDEPWKYREKIRNSKGNPDLKVRGKREKKRPEASAKEKKCRKYAVSMDEHVNKWRYADHKGVWRRKEVTGVLDKISFVQ